MGWAEAVPTPPRSTLACISQPDKNNQPTMKGCFIFRNFWSRFPGCECWDFGSDTCQGIVLSPKLETEPVFLCWQKTKVLPLALLSASLPVIPIKGHPADEKTSPVLITAVTTCSRRSSVIRSHPGSGVTHSSRHLSSALSPQTTFN